MKLIIIIFIVSHTLFAQVVHKINFDRFTHYDKNDWITFGYSNNITSIDIGINNIYFGTTGGGILQYDFYDNEWLTPLTTSNGLRSNHILKVVYDHSTNELYAATQYGVDIYNDAFEYWQKNNKEIPEHKSTDFTEENNVLPIFSRPEFEKWPTFFPTENYSIMLDGKLYDPNNEEYVIKDRIVDNWDRMWMATNGTGIGIGNLNTLELDFIKQSIPAIRPKDVLVNGDDIWIAGKPFMMSERGITHWDYEKNIWTYYKAGLDYSIFSDNITVIEKDGKNIFFGTEQGLLSYNTKKDTWKNLQRIFPIKNDVVNDLCSIDNIIYIATNNGVFSYDVKSNSAVQISKRYINQTKVNSLTRLKSNLYIATNYGIFKFNPKDNSTTILKSRAAIADNFVETIAADINTLWFSGQNGIGYYNIDKDKWQSFPALKYAFKSKINHIALTKDHAWFATDGGLLKYDTNRDYWYLYTTKDGLVDNRVSRIETDGDFLWLATYSGVTLFRWNSEGRIE